MGKLCFETYSADGSGFERLRETIPQKCDYLGVVYIIDYGGYVKVGMSKNPVSRIRSQITDARRHKAFACRFAVSQFHSEYIENERIAHKALAGCSFSGGGNEYFNLSFEDAVRILRSADFDASDHTIEKSVEDHERAKRLLQLLGCTLDPSSCEMDGGVVTSDDYEVTLEDWYILGERVRRTIDSAAARHLKINELENDAWSKRWLTEIISLQEKLEIHCDTLSRHMAIRANEKYGYTSLLAEIGFGLVNGVYTTIWIDYMRKTRERRKTFESIFNEMFGSEGAQSKYINEYDELVEKEWSVFDRVCPKTIRNP